MEWYWPAPDGWNMTVTAWLFPGPSVRFPLPEVTVNGLLDSPTFTETATFPVLVTVNDLLSAAPPGSRTLENWMFLGATLNRGWGFLAACAKSGRHTVTKERQSASSRDFRTSKASPRLVALPLEI